MLLAYIIVLHWMVAKINVIDEDGYTSLIHAAMDGRIKIVSILLEIGAKVDIKDYGNAALDYAREKNHKDVVAKLIEYDALR